jgi:hypothetical protein
MFITYSEELGDVVFILDKALTNSTVNRKL